MILLRYLLVTFESIISILLIAIILLQRARSEGLGGMAFGAGMGETLFGSRASNVLVKGTVILAVLFVLNTIGLAVLYSGRHYSHGLIDHRAAPIHQKADNNNKAIK